MRPKNWTPTYIEDPDGYDDLDITDRERIMPREKPKPAGRRCQHPPYTTGWVSRWRRPRCQNSDSAAGGAGAAAWDGILGGTVVQVSSGLCRVALPGSHPAVQPAQSRRMPHSGFSNVLAVGDEVVVLA